MSTQKFRFVLALLAAFVTWDRLIQHEYAAHRPDWERDGRLVGMFWRPPETEVLGPVSSLRVSWATHRAMFGWLFSTPAWAADDPEAVRLMRRLRLLVLVWNVGLLAVIAVGILLTR